MKEALKEILTKSGYDCDWPISEDHILNLMQAAYDLAKAESEEKITNTIQQLKDLQQDRRLGFMLNSYKYGVFILGGLLKEINPPQQ